MRARGGFILRHETGKIGLARRIYMRVTNGAPVRQTITIQNGADLNRNSFAIDRARPDWHSRHPRGNATIRITICSEIHDDAIAGLLYLYVMACLAEQDRAAGRRSSGTHLT